MDSNKIDMDKLGRILDYTIGVVGLLLAIKNIISAILSQTGEPLAVYVILNLLLLAGCVHLIRISYKES
jgi:hypothetical protein